MINITDIKDIEELNNYKEEEKEYIFKKRNNLWMQEDSIEELKRVSKDSDIDMFDYINYNKFECIISEIIIIKNNKEKNVDDIMKADGTLYRAIVNSNKITQGYASGKIKIYQRDDF